MPLATVEKATRRPDPDGRILGDDQADALTRIAASGRMLDVLAGPAGAGKTTAMNALHRAWEAEHGPGSVVGLAPSAIAAQVLADDLGIATENTAKWWHNHLRHDTTLQPGQLVIIDEADRAIQPEAFGPLTAELRRAKANHHNLDTLLPRLVTAHGFSDANDTAAIAEWGSPPGRRWRAGSRPGAEPPGSAFRWLAG